MTEKMPGRSREEYNRLVNEKSPYLIQHAAQPVDWYPWGEEAFKKAAAEDRPVIVSIGYSTCHWCHVMAEESFEDAETADFMNRNFVCIKVDREERPDIDAVFIAAVSSLTGSAGWPLNVFLTPEGRPFFGGTYFPPRKKHGMTGWLDVLAGINSAWKDPEQRKKIDSSAEAISQSLGRYLREPVSGPAERELSVDDAKAAVKAFENDFDEAEGGFSGAPKFPMPSILRFLLSFAGFSRENSGGGPEAEKALHMACRTLDAMACGGIFDHVGGGFHRYSTDSRWHVPHFEKMLYDNAQLASVYADAWDMTGKDLYRDASERTISFVLEEMTHPEGGFYSALDADSIPHEAARGGEQDGRKREGAFYVWRLDEIKSLMTGFSVHRQQRWDYFELFCWVYDIRSGGNAGNDPFGEFRNRNILHKVHSAGEAAERFGISEAEAEKLLDTVIQRLYNARLDRPMPHLDDKILTSWNGLMISCLARTSRIFGAPGYAEAAEKAACFIYKSLYDPEKRILFRRWREGEARYSGLADDYAYLIQGLLDLYEADFRPWVLVWAFELMEKFLGEFFDHSTGTVYMAADGSDPSLEFKVRDSVDNVEPSAMSAAALDLVRLSRITGNEKFETAADRIFSSAAGQAARLPKTLPHLMTAVLESAAPRVHVVIAGSMEEKDTRRMIEICRRKRGAGLSLAVLSSPGDRDEITALMPEVRHLEIPETGAGAQVCFNRACTPHTDSPEKLEDRLETGSF